MRTKVLIPVYKSFLASDEVISLASIRAHFSSEDRCFVTPESLDLRNIGLPDEKVERFEDDFFRGIEGYNRLMMSAQFYERFSESDYILICQLDCLIFRHDLNFWAAKGYDYIAAPWFKRFLEEPSAGLWRVGNGGFSLRKVQSHLRVLRQKVVKGSIYPRQGASPWVPTELAAERGLYHKIVPWYSRKNPFARWITVEEELRKYPRDEDLFWSLEAPKFDSDFQIASAVEALPFAFEMAPRWCFERNGRELPFGCHAWARYDRKFWDEILSNQ